MVENIAKDRINKVKIEEFIEAVSEPEFLYHYTDGKGFLGIIESKVIWGSNILYMNDSNEFILALKIAKNNIGNIKDENLKNGMLRYLSLIEDTEDGLFVASFSEKKDQLSQWRGYTGDYGFSIGFKIENLKNIDGRLMRCIYDKEKQENLIIKIINLYTDLFHQNPVKCDQICQDFAYDIVEIAPILKDEAFKEECEWRLISKRTPPHNEQVCYRVGKSTIIPYFKFKLGIALQNIEVILGPTRHPELAKRAATNALQKHRITDKWHKSPPVYLSSIPFRNWF